MMNPSVDPRRLGWRSGSFTRRLLQSIAERPALTGISLLGAMVVFAWAIAYWSGGSRTVAPHLFYVPVIFAAVRFGPVGALASGTVAGLAAGPLLPLNVSLGMSQEPLNWMLRLGAFVLVGLLCAFLVRHSRSTITSELAKVIIRRDLQNALDSGHLHVAYQPIVDLKSGRIFGAEALVRWSDPEQGPRFPDQFIPLVEAADIAHLISDFVLGEVSRQLCEWREAGLIDEQAGFTMAVNISGTELHDDRLENKVRAIVRSAELPIGWIHLEITETALIENLGLAVSSVRRLREAGLSVAIDDFGTGESSLRYLHKFQAGIIKIDRSFVTALVDDDRGRTIVAGIAAMASKLGMVTIAEGVESAHHAQILADLGCDMAQGYHFARPMPADAFRQQLRQRVIYLS